MDETSKKEHGRKESFSFHFLFQIIVRLLPVSPKYLERFAIRLLCTVVRGAMCFNDLRTLDGGSLCVNFQEAARVRGFVCFHLF